MRLPIPTLIAPKAKKTCAFAINGEARPDFQLRLANRGIPLIHISTDYVFDGCKGKPYVEHDKIGPLNTYGRSKAAGEHGVRSC